MSHRTQNFEVQRVDTLLDTARESNIKELQNLNITDDYIRIPDSFDSINIVENLRKKKSLFRYHAHNNENRPSELIEHIYHLKKQARQTPPNWQNSHQFTTYVD